MDAHIRQDVMDASPAADLTHSAVQNRKLMPVLKVWAFVCHV